MDPDSELELALSIALNRWERRLSRAWDSLRWSRGRSLFFDDRVLDLDLRPGGFRALVEGSRGVVYEVLGELAPAPLADLDGVAWRARLGDLRELLADPAGQDELAVAVVNLPPTESARWMPDTGAGLGLSCSCPDDALLCKHQAAALHLLIQRIFESPRKLLRLLLAPEDLPEGSAPSPAPPDPLFGYQDPPRRDPPPPDPFWHGPSPEAWRQILADHEQAAPADDPLAGFPLPKQRAGRRNLEKTLRDSYRLFSRLLDAEP